MAKMITTARFQRAASIVISLLLLLPAVKAAGEPACLCLVDLPDGARVEIDGSPVDHDDACLLLPPGTYLVTVFPRAAPPFEVFVDLSPGEEKEVRYVPLPTPPAPLAAPRARTEPVLGPALVGASAVVGLASAVMWMMASQSSLATAAVRERDDLDEQARLLMLDDLARREAARRDAAGASGAAAVTLLVAGGTLWAIALQDDGSTMRLQPHPSGLSLTVSLP